MGVDSIQKRPSTYKSLDQIPVSSLKSVGPRVAEKLKKLGIVTLQDILFHLPLRYQDRTRVVPMGSLRLGDQAVIEGEVELTEVSFGRRRTLLCRISDGTGSITLRFFHFSKAQQAGLGRGARLRCYGDVRPGKTTMEMIHPEYQRIGDNELPREGSLTPVYPTTEGVHQLTLRNLSDQVLSYIESGNYSLTEWLPDDASLETWLPSLPTLSEAIIFLHRPPPDTSMETLEQGRHPSQKRLAFEELLAHQLSLRKLRKKIQKHSAHIFLNHGKNHGKLRQQFVQQLPFKLTNAQSRVTDEIFQSLAHPYPMMRLVQGDVGSGKTVVAALAALAVIENDYQAALMAPTELLAEQHFSNLKKWLAPLGVEVEWLSGKHKGKARVKVLEKMADGTAKLVVGTHALFQDGVEFSDLALIVVDEQHRFGVHQRLALREKGGRDGRYPHQLIMTATPIPRTLAMTAYADLDISVIDELPPGRTPVKTVVIPDNRREEVIHRVRSACNAGQQAYWVCTLIEESDVLQCQAAEDTEKLLQEILPDLSIGLVHGRLKPSAKEAEMNRFKKGEINLLVATTVIEVGVDVPNASLMIIENAERLGLAQLHQLRGRVGRGRTKSNCVLMYHAPISQLAKERLAVMRKTNDGFEIAQKDLKIRGPGEILGTRQTGLLQLRIADLARDQDLLPGIRDSADLLLEKFPECVEPLIQRWVGENFQYGDV